MTKLLDVDAQYSSDIERLSKNARGKAIFDGIHLEIYERARGNYTPV
ncbi:hypothetical protein [Paenibacillus eucommiae]|uniref:Uncharacterized protein n=1 Tax=Paenibacillus eucommiae TaxID=1355755 RepID=A0ABS4J9Z3_9BACL|nr:hypothetical protein [Paenibacillus eucommiae]MBP1996664.1 hypothetical protein [Paenibacillus eucommiae]